MEQNNECIKYDTVRKEPKIEQNSPLISFYNLPTLIFVNMSTEVLKRALPC